MGPLLQVTDLTFSYDPKAEPLLRNITFACSAGKIYGLFGNNGSGKTTLFNIICGFTHLTAGQISYYGGAPALLSPPRICFFGVVWLGHFKFRHSLTISRFSTT